MTNQDLPERTNLLSKFRNLTFWPKVRNWLKALKLRGVGDHELVREMNHRNAIGWSVYRVDSGATANCPIQPAWLRESWTKKLHKFNTGLLKRELNRRGYEVEVLPEVPPLAELVEGPDEITQLKQVVVRRPVNSSRGENK